MHYLKVNYLRSMCHNRSHSPNLFIGITGAGYVHFRAPDDPHTIGKFHQFDSFSKTINRFIERRHTLSQVTPLKQRRVETVAEGQVLTVASTIGIIRELESNLQLHQLHVLEQDLINSICLKKQDIQDCREEVISGFQSLCNVYRRTTLTSIRSADEAEQSLMSYLENLSSYIKDLTTAIPPQNHKQAEALALLEALILQQLRNTGEKQPEDTDNKQESPARRDDAATVPAVTGSATTGSATAGSADSQPHSSAEADCSRSSPSQPFRRFKGIAEDDGERLLYDGRELRRYLRRLPTHIQLTQRVLDSMHEHPGMMELIARLAPHKLANDSLLAQQIRAAAAYLGAEPASKRYYLTPGELTWLILNGYMSHKEAGRVRKKPAHTFLCQESIRLRRIMDSHGWRW